MKANKIENHLAAAFAGLVILFCSPPKVTACLHTPRDYVGSIEEQGQEALVFYDDGREELLLKVAYAMNSSGKLPTSLAWVTPVPSVPDAYAVESPEVFEDLFKLSEDSAQYMHRGIKGGGWLGATLRFLEKVTVGEYEIQPIQAVGMDAGLSLNKWLSAHGYGEIPEKSMKYYVERGWTFLAVKVQAPRTETGLSKLGTFRPLRIGFAADRIYYPLKMSDQGTYDVTLYVVTRKGLVRGEKTESPAYQTLLDLGRFGFDDRLLSAPIRLSARVFRSQYRHLSAFWDTLHREGRIKFKKGIISKLTAHGINGESAPVELWKEDFSIALW